MIEYNENRDDVMKVADFLNYKNIKYQLFHSDGIYYIYYEIDVDDELKNECQNFIRRKKIEGILNDE